MSSSTTKSLAGSKTGASGRSNGSIGTRNKWYLKVGLVFMVCGLLIMAFVLYGAYEVASIRQWGSSSRASQEGKELLPLTVQNVMLYINDKQQVLQLIALKPNTTALDFVHELDFTCNQAWFDGERVRGFHLPATRAKVFSVTPARFHHYCQPLATLKNRRLQHFIDLGFTAQAQWPPLYVTPALQDRECTCVSSRNEIALAMVAAKAQIPDDGGVDATDYVRAALGLYVDDPSSLIDLLKETQSILTGSHVERAVAPRAYSGQNLLQHVDNTELVVLDQHLVQCQQYLTDHGFVLLSELMDSQAKQLSATKSNLGPSSASSVPPT